MQNSLIFVHSSVSRIALKAFTKPTPVIFLCHRTIQTINSIAQRKKNKFSENLKMSSKNQFSFSHYDAVGFDLDNCLVRYDVQNCIDLEYQCLAEFLVKKGYSKEFLLKPLKDDSDFLQKGLILDFEKGNCLRVCPGKVES